MSIILVLTGCAQKEQNVRETSVVKVGTTLSDEKEFHPLLSYSGTIMANKEASLGATLPGKIEKMYFQRGDEVPKGALMAELSGEMLTQARVEYDAIQRDFDRISRLKDKGSVSQMEYDHLKARLDASAAKVDMMQKHTQVIAPFSGTITDIMVNEGENYSLIPTVDQQKMVINNGILKLMQLNPIKVSIEVNEKDLSKIKIGQTANVSADAFPERSFTARVIYINPVLSSISRTAAVEMEIHNPGHDLKPGMYANVSLIMPSVKGIFIPLSAICRSTGTSNDYIFTLEGGKAHKLFVKQIKTEGDKVFVDGLAAGTVIIHVGKSKLVEGTQVESK